MMADNLKKLINEINGDLKGSSMVNTEKLDHELVGEINRAKILRLLRKNNEMTKAELGERLGVSHTTINTYIQMLMDEGFVEAFGTASSTGGRKPAIIRLIPNARYSFGVSFSPTKIEIMLINLIGEKIDSIQFPYSLAEGITSMLAQVKDGIVEKTQQYNIDPSLIAGVGLVFPGLVDEEEILLKHIHNLNINQYSLKSFEKSIGLPVFADNEANAGAYAEMLLGYGRGKGNFVYISIAEGIGTGIVTDNKIIRGRHKRAGEFGHIKISDEDMKCSCGRTGCWELFASKRSLLKDKSPYIKESEYINKLFRDYENYNINAISKIEQYVRHLFSGLEAVLLTVDPEYIVIGGDLGEYMQKFIDIGIDQLNLTSNFYGYENISIIPSVLKGSGSILGAALLPLEKIYRYQM